MKKTLLILVLLVSGLFAVYSTGVNEKEIDAEYAAKTYGDRSDWLYEFNQMANNVHNRGLQIIENREPSYITVHLRFFDEYSYRYKALLDIGVQRQFIDDKTRQQQIAKLREERDKVSNVLSDSSGLGL
jgi:hypothetical protein